MKIKILLVAGIALASVLPAHAETHPQGKEKFENYEKSDTLYRLSQRVYSTAVSPHWLGRSHLFWYKNHERGGDAYYLVDAESGSKQRGNSFDEIQVLFPDSLKEKKEPQRQQHTPHNGRFTSPDGKHVAYVRDHNICVRPIADGKEGAETVLTHDGTIERSYDTRLEWSPDSRRLAATITRRAETRRIPLLESRPEDQLQPRLQWIDYAKPGDVLPVSLPVLVDVEQSRVIPLETRLYENQYALYLTGWRADSRAFTFEFNQRGHQRYVVAEVDAATGKIHHIADEQAKTFVSYIDNFRFDLDDGRHMLWLSERDGWRHLYVLDGKTGNVQTQVTRGEWVVRSVERVDEQEGVVYLMAAGRQPEEDPYNMHYCRVRLDGTGFTDLTPENGNHRITLSEDHAYFVDVCSRPDLPPVSRLRRTADGTEVCMLEQADVSDLKDAGWQIPEVFHAKGRDGKTEIWGTIYRPLNFNPSKSYPVIEDIYAGPHAAHVPKDFEAINYFMQSLAEQGYIVVKIDGMGTNYRSKAFHDVCWKNLKDAGFPDRIAWMRAAAEKYKYIDLSRVGIYGWSAGGQNAMAALLWHNDFYKAAVSFCGCHDNRMDKVWWNELWMGYPVDEAYISSSNVENAHLLKGALLLANGEIDNNVDPASSLQVADALIKADKMFEQIYFPGKSHALGGTYEMHRLYEFFNRHLKNKKDKRQH